MNPNNGNRSGVMSATSYGLAPREHLDGAVAWVIRDAQASQPLLIVLSRQDLSDQWYAIARHLMYRDVQAFPTTNGRRVVKLYKDQQVQIEEAGVIRRSNIRFAAASVSTHIAPEMQRRHDGAKSIHVEGIGEVKLVQDSSDPAGSSPK